MKLQQWDLWTTSVVFEEDKAQAKERPALVLAVVGKDSAVGLYITSQSPRPGYRDFPIQNWQKCGLTKPSTIRLDRKVPMNGEVCRARIGRLDQETIFSLRLRLADPTWYHMKNKLP